MWNGLPRPTLKELGAALHLSTMWGFDTIREYLIKEISGRFSPKSNKYDPFEFVELADKGNMPHWKLPAYEAICCSPELPTPAQARKLGLMRLLVLCDIREKYGPKSLMHTLALRCARCLKGRDDCSEHTTVNAALRIRRAVLGLV